MKFLRNRLTVFFLLVMILMNLTIVNADVVPVQNNYSDLFSQSTIADGEYADALSIKLGKLFNLNEKKFLEELSKKSDDIKTKVSMLLVYDAQFNDYSKFEKTITKLSKGRLTTDESSVVNIIQSYIAEQKESVKNSQSTPQEPAPESPAFDSETVLKLIEVNKIVGGANESFYESFAEFYQLDPNLFAKTISSLSDGDIANVSKYIAYDYIKKGKRNFDSRISQTNSSKENLILSSIASQISNSENGSLKNVAPEAFDDSQLKLETSDTVSLTSTPEMALLATPTLSIGAMSYSSTAPVRCGESEILKVTYTSSAAVAYQRTYWTEAYYVRNGVQTFVKSSVIIIPAGQRSTTNSYAVSFPKVGPVFTLIKVYQTQGSSLLVSRQDSSPVIVTGKWRITVSLPINRDYKGALSLFGADGVRVQSSVCLGRSASNAAMNQTYGNTPTGTGYAFLNGYRPEDPAAYGIYQVVKLIGQSGILATSGRTGILIHGGRYPCSDTNATWYPLSPTHGCVRVAPTDALTLENNLKSLSSTTGYHDLNGTLSISQY